MTISQTIFGTKQYLVLLLFIMVTVLNACSTTKEKETAQAAAPTTGAMAPENAGETARDVKDAVPEEDKVTLEGRNFVLVTRYGQEKIVRTMLISGVDVNNRDELGNTALIAAASEGHKNLVTLLLSRGADVNAQSNDGTTALMAAAISGNIDIAKSLIDAGAKIDIKGKDGETALFDAVTYGHTGIVELLLAQGADPNLQNQGDVKKYMGYTPLMYAAQHGIGDRDIDWLAMTNILLDNGAKANITSRSNDTALSIAERNGFTDIADKLRKLGALDGMQYSGLDREDALIKASKLNDIPMVQKLLDGAAKTNYRDNITGVTSLLTAAYYGHAKVVRLLVEHDADVNDVPWGLTDQRIAASNIPVTERDLLRAAADGDTALITAVRNNNPDISLYLLDHGADVNLANRKEEIPAFVAASLGRSKIMEQLMAHGADPNVSRPDEHVDPFILNVNKKADVNPLLIEATENGHTDTAEVLLSAGADPNITDDQGRTALYWAVSQGFLTTVKALLERSADPNIKDDFGTTPLMIASKNGYRQIVELLIDKGADINVVEGVELEFGGGVAKAGPTALIYAARGGHAEIVRLLLTKGADAGLTTSNGESALRAAKGNGHADVVQILTELSFN